ncbi:MAG TPA: multidrug efflux RND transporter permease subunit [Vicinamibacterales bacterium]|jgi:HAE1 family hydrophobic/amphiphilic exporter-1|nr:multidrug efflux RND transporter permease subunit [Vicinamibacterales bacterium]
MARFFVNRPIVAIVISIVTVLLGAVAMQGLPIAQYPEIVPPMVQVTTTFIGASSTDVEASVATPLEQQINGVEQMIYMKSTNANDGTLTLKVSFEVGSNLDMDNVLTQNRVSQAQPQMPQSVKNYGVSVKKALAFPLLVISIKSPNGTYDSSFLSNYTTININDAIARIQGVGQINLFGGSDYAMRVWLRPDVIGRLGLTIPEIANAISAQNQLSPAGQIGGPPAAQGTEYTYTVRTQGRLLNEEEFGNILVRTTAQGEVRLRDVARLELGTMLYNAVGRHNGTPSAVIAVFQIPGTNALDVANRIKATMEQLKQRFPRDMEYVVSLDTTLPVTEGINEIVHTLFEAVGLVIVVVFVFLQNWRATLIPLMTVPVSLIGAFIFFPMLGFSINVLSLLGLVLAIGIVVDDAIVVVEAVMHHIEHGMEPKEATIKAMEEVSGPVVAIGLILAAVFVPVGFMGGISGLLYQQFAITIALSVLLSVVNALTLSPALAGMLLKPVNPNKKSILQPFYNGFNKVFGWTTDRYVSFAGVLVRKMFRGIVFMGVLIYLIVMLVQRIPGGFVPEEDQGYLLVNALLPDAASLERTDAVMKRVEKILEEHEAVEGFNTISGFSLITGAYSSNMGFFFVQLKPWEERHSPELVSFGVINALNRAFAQQIPEAGVIAFGPPAIPGLGTGSGFTMQLQDRSGGSPEYLAQQTQRFLEAARKRPEIGRIGSLYRASVPQIYADIDRSKVLRAGVPLNDVNTTLGALLGSSYINDFNRFGRVYKVYVQAEPEFRRDPKQIGLFFVKNKDGGMVPLDTLVSTRPTQGPEFTNRFNLFRSAELTGVPADGYSSTQALDALEATAREVLPPDMSFDWADMSFQERRAPGVATVFALAIFLVFLILAAQYESWGLPFSVLLGTPFAVFGAYLGLFLARTYMGPSYVNNVFAQIGLIMLIGLAAKNAILIVEFAKMEFDKGTPLVEAALLAAKLRFRPILMTAFAFILGVVPLLTASGAGAEGRKVMGMAVFAGMLVATILGVILIPMLYVLVMKVTGGARAPVPSAAPPPAMVPEHGGGH